VVVPVGSHVSVVGSHVVGASVGPSVTAKASAARVFLGFCPFFEGMSEGTPLGTREGLSEGTSEGTLLGRCETDEGLSEGTSEGTPLGRCETEGLSEGAVDETSLGACEREGSADGRLLGTKLGRELGRDDGRELGIPLWAFFPFLHFLVFVALFLRHFSPFFCDFFRVRCARMDDSVRK